MISELSVDFFPENASPLTARSHLDQILGKRWLRTEEIVRMLN